MSSNETELWCCLDWRFAVAGQAHVCNRRHSFILWLRSICNARTREQKICPPSSRKLTDNNLTWIKKKVREKQAEENRSKPVWRCCFLPCFLATVSVGFVSTQCIYMWFTCAALVCTLTKIELCVFTYCLSPVACRDCCVPTAPAWEHKYKYQHVSGASAGSVQSRRLCKPSP